MLCAQREGIGPTIYVVGGAVAIVVLLAASIAICRRRTHASTHRAWATYNTHRMSSYCTFQRSDVQR